MWNLRIWSANKKLTDIAEGLIGSGTVCVLGWQDHASIPNTSKRVIVSGNRYSMRSSTELLQASSDIAFELGVDAGEAKKGDEKLV